MNFTINDYSHHLQDKKTNTTYRILQDCTVQGSYQYVPVHHPGADPGFFVR
jgi:hypothetical protein